MPVNRNDPLALATTAAASEVAAAVQALAAANLQSPTDEALDVGDYGIYGVVSKISRKVKFDTLFCIVVVFDCMLQTCRWVKRQSYSGC